MKGLGYAVRYWWLRRFPRSVRFGWIAVSSGVKSNDMPRLGIGLAVIAFGLVRGRNRRLIYKASIDVDQGATIRVMRGRRPIAETTPVP
jgi:hypothetical protein